MLAGTQCVNSLGQGVGFVWVCSSDIVIGEKLLIWVNRLAIEILPKNHTEK